MGCGGSKEKVNGSPDSSNAAQSYDRRPKISVRVGPNVLKRDGTPRVVFIFGGPGSRKGRIVDDLATSYGFKFVSCEDLIFHELPKKVSNAMKLETIRDIRELLEEDPSHLTVEWVLLCVERHIERDADPSATYLVDFVPNLRYMLRSQSLTKDCTDAIERFEEKYPISFALNLAIPADKVLQTKQNYCAQPAKGEKMKETGGQGDEADSSRTQRRVDLYEQSARSLINYFATTERLVTVDVTCGVADIIWNGVHQILAELNFNPSRLVNTVLFFAFSESDFADIDLEKYQMELIDLKAIVDDCNDSVENLIQKLSVHLDTKFKHSDAFVISLAGTSVTQEEIQKRNNKPITFIDVDEGYLETYLPGSPKNFMPQPSSRQFRAVASLENEICLYPKSTDPVVCSRIAAHMAASRHI